MYCETRDVCMAGSPSAAQLEDAADDERRALVPGQNPLWPMAAARHELARGSCGRAAVLLSAHSGEARGSRDRLWRSVRVEGRVPSDFAFSDSVIFDFFDIQ